jgi:hypothetical protein
VSQLASTVACFQKNYCLEQFGAIALYHSKGLHLIVMPAKGLGSAWEKNSACSAIVPMQLDNF